MTHFTSLAQLHSPHIQNKTVDLFFVTENDKWLLTGTHSWQVESLCPPKETPGNRAYAWTYDRDCVCAEISKEYTLQPVIIWF